LFLDDIVSYYKLDNDVTDVHGTKEGTATNITYNSTDYVLGGYSANLNGTSAYVTIPSSQVADPDAWSVSIRGSMDSLASNNVFITLQSEYNIQIFSDTISGNILLQTYDGTTAFNSGNTTAVIDTLYHIVITYDGTTQKIYVNGVLDDSDAANTPSAYAVASRIGAHRAGSTYYD